MRRERSLPAGGGRLNRPLQKQRFEFKYLVHEPAARSIREFVQGHLELDGFGARMPDLSYPVHSLYLDSPGLALCQSTINGDRDRYKLRLRFYHDGPEAPVFLEIKRLHRQLHLQEEVRNPPWRGG